MQKVIAIVGPTASGKTGISIAIAKKVWGEIISADSRQIYRGLDIGSGKVTPEEMDGIPHHLLNVADPRDVFAVSEYVARARHELFEIGSRHKAPIVVGGTGFYIDALLGSISLPNVPADRAWREVAKKWSLEELEAELAKRDPEKAKTIDAKNRVRLVRAIEIARVLGKVPKTKPQKIYDVLWIGVSLSKKELDENIHTRLYSRMNSGMLEEAIHLHRSGLSYERMEELGLEYRYMARHLQGKISKEEMLLQLESEIKKYAKRQMTWFKRNREIHWLAPNNLPTMLKLSRRFLES